MCLVTVLSFHMTLTFTIFSAKVLKSHNSLSFLVLKSQSGTLTLSFSVSEF